MVYPGVQIKAIEGNTLLSDAYFRQKRTHLGVKSVPVHAQVGRGVPEADQSWDDGGRLFHEPGYCIALHRIVDRSPKTVQKHVRKLIL